MTQGELYFFKLEIILVVCKIYTLSSLNSFFINLTVLQKTSFLDDKKHFKYWSIFTYFKRLKLKQIKKFCYILFINITV